MRSVKWNRKLIAAIAGLIAIGCALTACRMLAITVPSFGARTRARVAMARADIRMLAVACEAYCIDWNTYPPSFTGRESLNGRLGPEVPASALPGFGRHLTTPIAYITDFPKDPFAPGGEATYIYWSVDYSKDEARAKASPVGGKACIIVSAGPDGDYDLAGEWKSLDPSAKGFRARLFGGKNRHGSALTYDPTNGTRSDGDIWRTAPWH